MIAEPRLLSAPRCPLDTANLHGIHVLVVDDNRDGADALLELLTARGATVYARYCGAGAVEAAVALEPDVVILDVAMPVMDGCEAAERIRSAAVPVPFMIALTGLRDTRTCDRAKQCGFDLHFIKPIEPGDLLHTLNAVKRILVTRRSPSGDIPDGSYRSRKNGIR